MAVVLHFEDLEAGQHYYCDLSGDVFEVVNNLIEYDEAADRLEGELHMRFAGNDEVYEFDVDELKAQGYPDEFHTVSERVAEAPEAIINEFAKKELRTYLDTLSIRHQFSGIEGVDTLASIVAARQIAHLPGGQA